jgi:uncharacterized protein YjiS (DUF1127 family)
MNGQTRRSIMSVTTTYYEGPATAHVAVRPKPKRSLLDRLIEARARQAEAHVRRHMSGLADETLRGWGLTGEQIASLRTKSRLPFRMQYASRVPRPVGAVRHDAPATPAKADRWIMRATKSGLLFIGTLVVRCAERRLHRLAKQQLRSMSDRMLMDIGISRSEIDQVVEFGREATD